MIVCNTMKELTNATNVSDAAGAVAVKEYVAEHAGGDLTPSTTVTVSGVEKTLQAYVEDIAEDQAQIYTDDVIEKSTGTLTTQDEGVTVTEYTLNKQLNICHLSVKFTYEPSTIGTKTLFLLPSDYAVSKDTEITFYENAKDLPCAGRISSRYVSLYVTDRNNLTSGTWYGTATWIV